MTAIYQARMWSFCLVLFFSQPVYSSDDSLTSEHVYEGLITAINVIDGRITNLAAEPQDVFMIRPVNMPDHPRRPHSFVAVHVLRGLQGFIQLYRWDEDISDLENYAKLDEHLYQTGSPQAASEAHVASLSYELGEVDRDTYCWSAENGYEWAKLSQPLYYGSITDITIEHKYKNTGLTTRLLYELSKFLFHTQSVGFVCGMVNTSNPRVLIAYSKNGFRKRELIMKHLVPGIEDYASWEHAGYMVKLSKHSPYFTPVMAHKFNFYLPKKTWLAHHCSTP